MESVDRPQAHLPAELARVLEAAASLQRLVPDAVLVGGSAAALHAHHRISFDHDHVITDLRDRFEVVLDALEREPAWLTNRVTPGKIILGELGDIEAGVRQIIRTVPLEVQDVRLPSGASVRVPTAAETLRIKAFLIVRRNQVRDFVDVAALSDLFGIESAAAVLADIDRYYTDPAHTGLPVSSQVVRQLGDPRPADRRTVAELGRYKGLREPWQDWDAVRARCRALAALMISGVADS